MEVNRIISHEEIAKLGFKYFPMVVEDEFQYEYWTKETFGIRLEITNEYELNGSLIKQVFELNDIKLRLNAQGINEFIKHLKKLELVT